MSFGDDNSQQQIIPPSVPASPPPAPQFATNAARPVARGKPYGGTLLTSPINPTPAAATARTTLLTT